MKFLFLLPLFAGLLLTLIIVSGKKSSSEGSDSTGESAEASADTAKPIPAESPSEEPSDTPNSLSDADVDRLLKEAVDYYSLEKRDDLFYQNNEPYSGGVKTMYDSGQVCTLAHLKNGVDDGPWLKWYENGQKWAERTLKDGKPDGLQTYWHQNGQKALEGTFKDGEEVSVTYWNSTGEEVETEEEAYK